MASARRREGGTHRDPPTHTSHCPHSQRPKKEEKEEEEEEEEEEERSRCRPARLHRAVAPRVSTEPLPFALLPKPSFPPLASPLKPPPSPSLSASFVAKVAEADHLLPLLRQLKSRGGPSFHLFGFIMCIGATAARALKTVLQGILLSSEGEKLNSLNLLLYMAPVALVLLLPATFIMEKM